MVVYLNVSGLLMQHAQDKIIARIHRLGPGSVFSPKDFIDLGSRGIVDVTLSKLAALGTIRRIGRGVYEYPKTSKLLGGTLSPDIDQVAQAVARRFRWRIVPDGAVAANLLGLSTQVPARIVYLSDGPSRQVAVGPQAIQFKHARPKQIGAETPTSSLVIQALRCLGREAGTRPEIVERLREKLTKAQRRAFVRDARHSSDWIFTVARRIAQEART